jgi:hypothetical protein
MAIRVVCPRIVGHPEEFYLSSADRVLRGLLHGINTGMCHKRDLTDQQWKILDPEAH